MKSLHVSVGILALVMSVYFVAGGQRAAAGSISASMGIQIVSPTGPVQVPVNGKLKLSVRIHGLILDPKAMGRSAVPGHGHYHIYIDCIPNQGYSQVVMSRCFAAASAATTTDFDLAKSLVKIGPGTHTLLVALAQNDHVLYKVPPAAMLFTVVRTRMSIHILGPLPSFTTSPHGKVTLRLKIIGLTLAPKAMGHAAVPGEGHYHIYIDCIPPNAYQQVNMTRCFAGALASPTATLDFSKSMVKVTKGTHLLLLALARNDHLLYPVPAASVVFTVK